MQRDTNFTNGKRHGNLIYTPEIIKSWRVMVSAGMKYPQISKLDPLHPHPKLISRKLSEELNTAR